jgi:hypothetical protein
MRVASFIPVFNVGRKYSTLEINSLITPAQVSTPGKKN